MTTAPPTEPGRLHAFARFFKSYMSVWALITAALPIPATLAGFIPTYAAHTKPLSVYTSLFCFLLLALIFYFRHSLAGHFFPRRDLRKRPTLSIATALPAGLIILCAMSVLGYQVLLSSSVSEIANHNMSVARAMAQIQTMQIPTPGNLSGIVTTAKEAYEKELEALGGPDLRSTPEILADTDLIGVPYGEMLIVLYLLTFLFAEGAFILMAMREYLQDILGLSDKQLIEIETTPLPPGVMADAAGYGLCG
jgi:hypothetical protein